ncbi:serine O-acetyltransferase [Metabacillus elymi]|uniref:Serine acetyltransferase n=1 Tax=Metabacillus elymi TaxID=2745198 RepID=A0ABX6S1P2_9BACI|nr:DapH/DapD/GlmU-related protein [Metabacillus sp. KUDC1714]QNF27381.1 serine acetyltransferase [Metabacillus sp. KUDC1714]
MIKSKEELINYLAKDKIALYKTYKRPKLIGDEIWRFQIIYRKYEYTRNCLKKKIHLPYLLFLKYRFNKLSIKLGFSIPINTIESGLSIAHYGTIVINGNSKIGKNCRIQEGVTIGATSGEVKAPLIGDNVFIGSGAKIIGDIKIADDVVIGAGSVVVKSIYEKGITVAGVPAKKASNNNSLKFINSDLLK